MPQVLFLLSVRNELAEPDQEEVASRLEALYPKASAVVVLQRYRGFDPGPKQFIHLVEVHGAGAGRYIVKLDVQKELSGELDAWERCRPVDFTTNPVFMPLVPLRNRSRRLDGLQYSDGGSFIGGLTTSLEKAFLSAVRYGTPKPTSVERVIADLYRQVKRLLHDRGSKSVAPRDVAFLDDPDHGVKLTPSLKKWNEKTAEPWKARLLVNTWADQKDWRFRDPVDYLSAVQRHLLASVKKPAPSPDFFIPPTLRVGYGHGDLHGRNVLVGIAEANNTNNDDFAIQPVLFDYEHMGRENLIAWDFVKLETELKVRAFRRLFPGVVGRGLIEKVQRFELELADATREGRWQVVKDEETEPLERLKALLHVIRQFAMDHLASPTSWLTDWHFATACYGAHVGRFGTYHEQYFQAAYVAAGVAVGQMRRWNEGVAHHRPRYGQQTRVRPMDLDGCADYNEPIQIASGWRATGKKDHIEAAEELLREAHARFQHSLAVVTEWALTLYAQKDDKRGDAIMKRYRSRFHDHLDEEAWSLLGKRSKNLGYEAWDCGDLGLADNHFAMALQDYESAFAIRGNHFPGINTAALHFFRAAIARQQDNESACERFLKVSRERATQVRSCFGQKLREDDDIWELATDGEAALILGRGKEAARRYQSAMTHLTVTAFHKKSSGTQARRLLQAWAILGAPPEITGFDADQIFGPA